LHYFGQDVHGNGAHTYDLETHELLVLPQTCFSVEPRIDFADFGIRNEVKVFVDRDRTVHVTGGLQTEVLPILRT
jgi:hypothetical protein